MVRAGIVGVLAGLVAVAFRRLLSDAGQARNALLEFLHSSPDMAAWGWMVLPAAGLVVGSLVGWTVVRLAPDARGSGIPHLKGVLVHLREMKWRWLLPVKFFGGVAGIGAGLSLGHEGPTVQLGAGVGRAVADLLRVPQRSIPQLLSCGAGAGLSAAFNAPLAGFLFVIEELHRELSARTFAGALVAALSADIVTRALSGDAPSFAVHSYPSIPLTSLPVAVLIGGAGGLVGVAFNRCLLFSGRHWGGYGGIPAWLKPGVAAALCGVVAWWLPEAVGGGHATADALLRNHVTPGVGTLAVLLIAKFTLTVFCFGSGAPGGIFAPLLLMGVILGALVAQSASEVFPTLDDHATAFAILGMAAVFTGSARVPLTAIVLMIELTGNYQQLLALGVVCLFADLTASALRDMAIDEVLLEEDLRRAYVEGKRAPGPVEPRTVYVGVQRNSELAGRMLREAPWPTGCLVVSVERGGREILPAADLTMSPGDHLTVLVPSSEAEKALAVVRLATGF